MITVVSIKSYVCTGKQSTGRPQPRTQPRGPGPGAGQRAPRQGTVQPPAWTPLIIITLTIFIKLRQVGRSGRTDCPGDPLPCLALPRKSSTILG